MPTGAEETLTDRYVKHALTLIRVANGLKYDAGTVMRALSKKLSNLIRSVDLANANLSTVRSIITQADTLIYDHIADIEGSQNDAAKSLIEIESQWAKTVGKYDATASDAAVTRAFTQLQVAGNTIGEHFDTIANRLRQSTIREIRLGTSAGQSEKDIASRIIGQGRARKGGTIEKAARDIDNTITTATQAAADAGRRAAQAANGISALKWHAVLDLQKNPGLCPDCLLRANKVWKIDGTPVDSDIPYAPIPLHIKCHCLYIPLKLSSDKLDNLPDNHTFEDWLGSQSKDEQEKIFGKGRLQLYNEGLISSKDLIGQNGLVMSLAELKAQSGL